MPPELADVARSVIDANRYMSVLRPTELPPCRYRLAPTPASMRRIRAISSWWFGVDVAGEGVDLRLWTSGRGGLLPGLR